MSIRLQEVALKDPVRPGLWWRVTGYEPSRPTFFTTGWSTTHGVSGELRFGHEGTEPLHVSFTEEEFRRLITTGELRHIDSP